MLSSLSGLQTNLSINLQPFLQGLSQANLAVRGLGTQLQNAFSRGLQNGLNNSTRGVNAFSSALGNIRNIVGGILISQTFYAAANAIEDAVTSVIKFNMNMETAQASFARLLGSTDQAKGFLAVMQDFAAVTPFTVEQTVEMSRRMMAMGFEAKSLKNVMTTITDATAAVGGGSEKLDRIVLALGQIKTNGKLAGQEIRQLGEAGIPVRKILQEQLGLTSEQLAKIGKLGIDGETAVTAILQGMEKRYKGMNDIIANTTQGMLSTIKDDFLIIGGTLSKNLFNTFSGAIRTIRNGLEDLRKSLKDIGSGGFFARVIPPELQVSIKSILVAFQSLGRSIYLVVQILMPIFSAMSSTIIRSLGIILPPIAALIQYILELALAAIKTVPAVKFLGAAFLSLITANLASKVVLFLWRIVGMGSICTTVATAVQTLTAAIRSLYLVAARNPIIGIILLLAGALLALALNSEIVSRALDKVIAKMATILGFNTEALMKGTGGEEYSKLMAQFNEEYEGMTKNLKNVGKTAEESGKKVKDKFVASFDELYQIPDLAKDAGTGLEDLIPPGLDNLPGIPNMPGLLDDKTTKDQENWWDNLLAAAKRTSDGIQRMRFDPPFGGTAFATITDAFVNLKVAAEGQLKAITDRMREAFEEWSRILKPINVSLVLGQLPAMPSFAPILIPVLFGAIPPIPPLPSPEPVLVSIVFGFEAALASLREFFTITVPTTITSAVISVYTTLVSVGNQAAEKFKNALVNPIKNTVYNLFYSDIPEQIGRAITNTITNIIDTAAQMAKEFYTNFVSPALEGIANFFTVTLPNFISDNALPLLVIAVTALGVAIVAALIGPITVAASATGAVTVAFVAVVGAILLALGLLFPKIKEWWDKDVEPKLLEQWGSFKEKAKKVWEDISIGISDTFSGLGTKLTEVWSNIKTGLKGVMIECIGIVNTMIDKLNTFKISVPRVTIPGIGIIGGGEPIGLNIPRLTIPELAGGGIVNKDSLIRAGEGGNPEAVVPLNNPSAMRPFIEMLVSELQKTSNQGMNYYNIGTLIGDERSLKELERKLNAIRLMENQRTGVIAYGV